MVEVSLTFWEHVSELQRALVQIFVIILLSVLCTFFFYQEIVTVLTSPLQDKEFQHQTIKREKIVNPGLDSKKLTLPPSAAVISKSSGSQEISDGIYLIPSHHFVEIEITSSDHRLVLLGPLEGFLTSMKISFWVGLIGSSPLWILILMKFIAPAMQPWELRALWRLFLLSLSFMTAGVLVAFFIAIPLATQYLEVFNGAIGTNLWTLSSYLDFAFVLMIGHAMVFELGLILLFCVHYRIFSEIVLIEKRRHFIVAAFIIGALLTPPDIPTQLMLAIPLIGLYELAIFYAKFRVKLTLPEHE